MVQILRRVGAASLAMLGVLVWSGCDFMETYVASSCGPECSLHEHGHHSHEHEASDDNDSDDSHTHIGPNGGHLIVLGDEDYHAELIIDHDKAEATVCMLDRTGRKPVCVDQSEITLNIRSGGLPHQIRLNAVEANGTEVIARSCFRGTSEVLRSECQLAGRLNVVIKGKPYTGQVAHHEDDHKLMR